jgi:hypothetical protein
LQGIQQLTEKTEKISEKTEKISEKTDKVSEEVVRILDERETKRESLTVKISEATQNKVKTLLNSVDLRIEEEEFVGELSSTKFLPFDWNGRTEDEGTDDAKKHLEKELVTFGVEFGRGHFKLVDCHKDNSLLNIDDPKIGKISGGTDLVIVPYKTPSECYSKLMSVLFE